MLEEYNFEFKNLPGKDNICADFISRYCFDNKNNNNELIENIKLNLINKINITNNINKKDNFFLKYNIIDDIISAQTKFGINSFDNHKLKIEDNKNVLMNEDSKIIIPKEFFNEFFFKVHSKLGHPNKEKLWNSLKKYVVG